MATVIQIANNITIGSPDYRVVKFLAKAYLNRNQPQYKARISKLITDGKMDIVKLRALFIRRELTTGTEFDSAITRGVKAGVLTNDLKETGATLLEVYTLLEARAVVEDNSRQVLQEAEMLFKLPDYKDFVHKQAPEVQAKLLELETQ